MNTQWGYDPHTNTWREGEDCRRGCKRMRKRGGWVRGREKGQQTQQLYVLVPLSDPLTPEYPAMSTNILKRGVNLTVSISSCPPSSSAQKETLSHHYLLIRPTTLLFLLHVQWLPFHLPGWLSCLVSFLSLRSCSSTLCCTCTHSTTQSTQPTSPAYQGQVDLQSYRTQNFREESITHLAKP